MENEKTWYLTKEVYPIVGIEDKYITLLITVYQDSQFHIVFNQRRYFPSNWKEDDLNKLIKKGEMLKELIVTAETELGFTIKSINYNLPVRGTKIVPYSFFYQFSKPTIFTPAVSKWLNNKFLKDYEKESDYQNVLFHVNEYALLDQKEIWKKPPYGQKISSIKISGYLYLAKWEQLYEFSQIFLTAETVNFQPVLLPHAIHINLNFLQKTANSILVWWKEKECQILVFTNNIFSKYLILKCGKINNLLAKISEELSYDLETIKKYLYNFFNLEDKNKKTNSLKIFNKSEKNKFESQTKVGEIIKSFIEKAILETELIIDEKLKLINQESKVFVMGDISQISGIDDFLKNLKTSYKWEVYRHTFIGLKDNNDSALIGNAYFQHLQNKLLYNQNQLLKLHPKVSI